MTSPDGAAKFRRWLVDRLKQTRWARIKGERIEATAERLLVHPDALRLAQRALDEERQRDGRVPVAVGSRHRGRLRERIIEIAMPAEVHADWQAYCKQRQLSEYTILRSLAHALLLNPRNPTYLGRGWPYRKHWYRLDGHRQYRRRGEKWPWTAKTTTTMGASQALLRRASQAGVSVSALLRGAVLDLLERRTLQFQIVTAADQMWDDPDRYVTTVDSTASIG